ncbi:MAG TPA: NAD(+) synthase [Acidobacteriota bacterium]|nr:NAD(+) synthase [Acidobacteriota bacterium]
MKLKISLAQINPSSGDLFGNRNLILRAIEKARTEQADVVLLPEMCLTGYCLDEKLLINLHFLRENRRILMEEILPACQSIAAVVGFVDFDEDKKGPDRRVFRYNAAAVIQNGRLLKVVHKRLLPSYRYFDDKRYFRPGLEAEPIPLKLGESPCRVGVLICEDLWDEGYDFKPFEEYARRGVDYIFCISASPFVASNPGEQDGKRFVRERLAREHCTKFGIPLIWVNTVGVGDNGKNIIVFDGFSTAYDCTGTLVANLPAFREAQQSVVFEQGRARPCPVPPLDREEEILQALVLGVRDYYEKIGIFRCVLEAVSGGVDSALGAAIACEAMGSERVRLYNLPSRFNTETTQRAARQLACNLAAEYHVVPIQQIVDRVTADFEKYLHPIQNPATIENLQARIRGLFMMAESNDLDALLLTNGNETEIALGYSTLYGDMVGGLAVIGDLAKTDVYRLARHVNQRAGREIIPEDSLTIPASAELAEGQVDPFDYDVVGPLVSDLIEQGWSPRDVEKMFRERRMSEAKYGGLYERYTADSIRRLATEVYRKINQSVYKRMQAAPIIVVSDRAFGFDLREAIINRWGE